MSGSVRRRGGVLVAVTALLSAALGWLGSAGAHAQTPGEVTMAITDVRPNTPPISAHPSPLSFSITLTNHTSQPIHGITVSASRSDPIGSQQALDTALKNVKPPSPDQEAPIATKVTTDLQPSATRTTTLHTTIGTDPTLAEVCECYTNFIFPIYFVATIVSDGATVQLATAQTYLPAFTSPPVKAAVGWVWPLLDRPHRLKQDDLFGDDDLATEVSPGGRLDRLLTVLERVSGKVPMTVLTDPDLIDELAVMSSARGYRVVTSEGSIVKGTGGNAAAVWLGRLDTLLADHPKLEVEFTPYADPAVESLTRSGLTWHARMPSAMQSRVTAALDGLSPPSNLAWPVGQALSATTLDTLAKQDVQTVVLTDHALTGPPAVTMGTSADGGSHEVVPDALAPLGAGSGGTVTAAVTSTPIERLVAQIVPATGKGLTLLPQLVAELAIRVITSVSSSHYVVITPPRHLDVVPDVAVRTILATADTIWARPLAVGVATQQLTPVDHGHLRARLPAPVLPARTVKSIRALNNALPTLATLYAQPSVAAAQIAPYPAAIQRCESTSLLYDRPQSVLDAGVLEKQVNAVSGSVRLIKPANGTYTLTSSNAKLPITVANTLPQDVQIKVVVTSVSGDSGLSADDIGLKTIPANQRVQLRIPTHVDRVGLISVSVSLVTRGGLTLPSTIDLKIRSTALGTVGVVITIIAAVVLAVALLIRFIRRFRHWNTPTGRGRPAKAPPAAT